MSKSADRFDFSELGKDHRANVRAFFHKWMEKLNDGNPRIGFGPISVDLRDEFEKRLSKLDDKTLNEMVEDAKNL